MPPEAPASGMTWITRRRAVSTMRMSLAPRPAETVHRKRPSAVTAPPVGKLPSVTWAPSGVSWRPLSRNPVAGSGALGAAAAEAAANPAATTTSTNLRDSRRIVIGLRLRVIAWMRHGSPVPDPLGDRVVDRRDIPRASHSCAFTRRLPLSCKPVLAPAILQTRTGSRTPLWQLRYRHDRAAPATSRRPRLRPCLLYTSDAADQ